MFERFTDRARRAVVLAQEECRLTRNDAIGTEHLLLGLIHEGEGVACAVLTELGVTLESVREAVDKLATDIDKHVPHGHIPFTIRTKKVLELSLREALQLGHNYIGTEHILLAIIREGEGTAAHVMVRDLNLDLSDVRRAVVTKLSSYHHGEKRPAEPVDPDQRTYEDMSELLADAIRRRLANLRDHGMDDKWLRDAVTDYLAWRVKRAGKGAA